MRKSKVVLGVKAVVWQIAVWLLAILVLFLPAGTFAWPAGWIFFATFFGFVLFLSTFLLKYDPHLLEERLTILKPEQQGWDKVWLICFYLLSLAWLALMPLDAVQWHWSWMSTWFQGVGILLLLCSLVIIFFTVRANSYLSPTVRIQRDRGHTIVTRGPYSSVRHPLYSGAVLFYVGVPLLLGSWLGLVFSLILLISMLALRAILEERMLRQELPGYAIYMTQVRYRFIPHVW